MLRSVWTILKRARDTIPSFHQVHGIYLHERNFITLNLGVCMEKNRMSKTESPNV